MQTDIIIYRHLSPIDAPRTLAYFQHLGAELGLKFAYIDLGSETIELVDGTRFEAGDVVEIEEDLLEPAEQVQRDIARGDWSHLPSNAGARYQLTNRTSGLDLGTYEGATAQDAIEAMHKDAGYASTAAAAEALGTTAEALISDIVATEAHSTLTISILSETASATLRRDTDGRWRWFEDATGADMELSGATASAALDALLSTYAASDIDQDLADLAAAATALDVA